MTTRTAPATSTWTIDASHSEVGFAVKHLMISTVRGRFAGVTGSVTFADGDFSQAAADVTIDAASIDTREDKRDAHLRSADFFDVEKFPVLTFKSRRVQAISGDTFQLVGDLTIKDTSKEVVLDVEFEGTQKDPWGNQKSGFTATTKISRTAFGLTWNAALETGGVLVGDEIKISLDVQLLKTT
ncbi:MAG: YceI family protein [Acidimicrobiia bacterium]|nr:YceI family protein [Acidimicrobiia bacterium]